MSFHYPCELEEQISLRSGELLRIRPLRRGDEPPIRQLYGNLTPETRYLRFFSPMPLLPDSVVRLITCVDYRRKLALLAELDTADGVQVVALGSFAAIGQNTAEVAMVVADQWQRKGIGTVLASKMLLAAEARGFDRYVAHVLHGNAVIRRLLNDVALIVSTRTHHAASEMCFVRRRVEGS